MEIANLGVMPKFAYLLYFGIPLVITGAVSFWWFCRKRRKKI